MIKQNTSFGIVIVVGIISVLAVASGCIYNEFRGLEYKYAYVPVIVNEFPIWRATMPFGTLILDGKIRGGILFLSGEISETEVYIIKYLDGTTLRTVIVKAAETPIEVDGRFQIDIVYTDYMRITYKNGVEVARERYQLGPSRESIRLHIPKLPEKEG